MRNIKLEIEYDGRCYCGWQVQNRPKLGQRPKAKGQRPPKSIQEVIEKALRKILQKKANLIVSGRTDAGVHALAQVANFKSDTRLPCWKLQRALNAHLPEDIAIAKAEDVDLNFHSRFAAKSKIYRYTILNRTYPSALLKDSSYFYPYPLNIDLMRKEARLLLGKHDFMCFCASNSKAKDMVRTIKKIIIKKSTYDLPALPAGRRLTAYGLTAPSLITIDIEADGFLYNMVRNIVGTLLEIGRGKLKPGSAEYILSLKNRRLAGPTVPAKGLCLLQVKY